MNGLLTATKSAQITRIAPYSGGPKNQKLNIWRINSLLPPRSYKQAVVGENNSMWIDAMKDEYALQIANKTWTLSEKPPNVKAYPLL